MESPRPFCYNVHYKKKRHNTTSINAKKKEKRRGNIYTIAFLGCFFVVIVT